MWDETSVGGAGALVAFRDGVWMMFGWGPRFPVEGAVETPPEALLGAPPGGARALRWCRQVHGRILASLSPEPGKPLAAAGPVGRCDGLLTDEPGILLAVRTADCVPVLIHGGGVVAAVHAGWRGAAAGIVTGAVRRFLVEYGVRPDDLAASLGPHVGPCHYEVGPEVVEALRPSAGPEEAWLRDRRVDLGAVLRHQLVAAGLRASAVETVGGCTACDPGLASYRRDGGAAGRQWSAIVLVAE